MNATEHLVELYYRQQNNLTFTDFKVEGGNNRQFDVLAYHKPTDKLRHIEVSVTHWMSKNDATALDNLEEKFNRKFFGAPRFSTKQNSDFQKGVNYKNRIQEAYKEFGFEWNKVIRVWCLWTYPSDEQITQFKNLMAKQHNLQQENFEILSLRDDVIPFLQKQIGTSNYDNHILRVLSLLNQSQIQKDES